VHLFGAAYSFLALLLLYTILVANVPAGRLKPQSFDQYGGQSQYHFLLGPLRINAYDTFRKKVQQLQVSASHALVKRYGFQIKPVYLAVPVSMNPG
jgi:hypothetical protein